MLSFFDKEKYSLKISASKTSPKNIFPKTFSAISHEHFSDQKKGCAVSSDNLSIQIEGQSILHNHFSDQKKGRAVSSDNLSIQIEEQSILHEHFSDQKNSRSIFHDQKLILRIDLFVRQDRGVLNTPHM